MLENTYTLFLQISRRNHDYDVKKNVRVLFKEQVDLLFDDTLEFFSVTFRNTVPLLWLAIMAVVD